MSAMSKSSGVPRLKIAMWLNIYPRTNVITINLPYDIISVIANVKRFSMKYYSTYFGQAYGEGNYGECLYSPTTEQQQASNCAAAGTANGGASGGGLSDTGIGIVAVITLACLIIFAALLVRIWRRKPALQPVVVTSSSDQQDRTPPANQE